MVPWAGAVEEQSPPISNNAPTSDENFLSMPRPPLFVVVSNDRMRFMSRLFNICWCARPLKRDSAAPTTCLGRTTCGGRLGSGRPGCHKGGMPPAEFPWPGGDPRSNSILLDLDPRRRPPTAFLMPCQARNNPLSRSVPGTSRERGIGRRRGITAGSPGAGFPPSSCVPAGDAGGSRT